MSLAAVVQTAGQESQPPPIQANVREVRVPVVVTNQSGQYATGLNRDDFEVFENGKPQQIVSFSRPRDSASVPAPGKAATSKGASIPSSVNSGDSPRRTYLICVDTLHLAFNHFAQIRRALAEYFAHEQPGDSQYVLIALGRRPRVLVDSTRDPAVILNAVNSKSLLTTIQDSEAVSVSHDVERFVELVSRWCGNCNCASPRMDMAGQLCPTYKGQVQAAAFSFSERAYMLNQNFLQALKNVVSAMSGMPTERSVLFASDGFNRFPGEELYAVLRSAGVGDLNLLFSSHDLQPQLEDILRMAVKYDVRFYTIDSRGLYTGSEVPGSGEDAGDRGGNSQAAMQVAWSNGDAMSQLARKTGGQFFENSNDLLKGIQRTFADGREEYVLGYSPRPTKLDGKFRKITVRVKDKALRVTAKTGYWASP